MSVRTLCLLLLLTAQVHAEQFIPLSDLPGGVFGSEALGVDSSGFLVVGSSASSEGSNAFVWTESGGLQSIAAMGFSAAVSSDGQTVVGAAIVDPVKALTEPFRWTRDDGLQLLGLPLGENIGTPTFAVDVSHDGSIITGTTIFGGNYQAYHWAESEGFFGLGDLSGGTETSAASAISADGGIVVGSSISPSGNEAFRWTLSSGMEGIGDLSGGQFASEAVGISPEGSVIVGTSDSAGGREAFRWTEATGMEGLGFLPNSPFESVAIAATHSGQAIVGFSGIQSGRNAFVWTEAFGMRALQEVLVDQFGLGTELADWQLTIAYDISPNGRFIVGSGINPAGNQEAWLVRLDRPIFAVPEPNTLLLTALSLVGMLCYHRPRSA